MKVRVAFIAVVLLLCGCGSSSPQTTPHLYGQLGNERTFGTVVSVSGTGSSPFTLHYVIRKDSGQQVKIDQVPEEDETILYPGQRAMIQTSDHYLRVYPADVEETFQSHVPGVTRQHN